MIRPEYFALFDNNYHKAGESYLLRDPVEWVRVDNLSQAADALARIDAARAEGLWAGGFASYELARHFGFDAHVAPPDGVNFLTFGIFGSYDILDHDGVDEFLDGLSGEQGAFLTTPEHQTTREEYDSAIDAIKSELEAGNSYQVNYTIETQMRLGGHPARLYRQLRATQPVPYGAYLHFPEIDVLSRSPELFFEKRGGRLTTRPMKGTARRGANNAEDVQLVLDLRNDPKQQAENLMIVDLLRNDMSIIAKMGSVRVDPLFEVEHYKTVHQMTSTIHAEIDTDADFGDLCRALYPSGSITGAPKHATTQIIKRLEPNPRGIYTGAIGFVDPSGDMVMNVPIRTLQIPNTRVARLNIGSGIVYDSVDASEYEEAILKGRFVFDLPREFELIESFYGEPNQPPRHLTDHLARMNASAQMLGLPFDAVAIDDAVARLVDEIETASKLRITIDAQGRIDASHTPITPQDMVSNSIILWPETIDAHDAKYAHKTTLRSLYTHAFRSARADHKAYDVIFANQYGHLTEASNHNLVLRINGQLVTPPLSAGILPGIGREKFIDEHEVIIRDIGVSELADADEVLLVSSVRGVIPVKVLPT